MEASRDAGSIPAASILKGLVIRHKSFFFAHLRDSQSPPPVLKTLKYPSLYPIFDAPVSDFVESETSIRPVIEIWATENGALTMAAYKSKLGKPDAKGTRSGGVGTGLLIAAGNLLYRV